MENIKIPLSEKFELELNCFYEYEPEAPESDLNPRENASVELIKVYLGGGLLSDFNLSEQQRTDIEQYILEQKESE